MEVRPGNQIYYLQPFLKNSETKYFPLRWEHYNKIKHDKINCYTQCTFRDLINSLWAYYMLINYFVLSVNWPVYQNGIIKSKIYKPTIWRLEYPETVWNLFAYFRDDRSWNYYKKVMHNGKEVIPSEYDDKTMEWLSSIIDEAERKHVVVNGITKRNYLKTENFFFYYSFVQYNLTHWFRAGQIEKDSCWRLIVQKNINLPWN